MTGTATTTPQIKNLIGRASVNKRAARAVRTYEQVRPMPHVQHDYFSTLDEWNS